MGKLVTVMGAFPEQKNTRQELKKHSAIIHCTNHLTLLQRKISNALLYHAYDRLMTQEEHEISIKDLCRLIAYQGNNHAVIRDALRGLLSTVIEWNVVDDATGLEDWSASAILASVSLRGPLCLYAYSPRMKKLLYSPTMFGKINLFIQSRFRSNYGLALYENCIRYRSLGVTKWFEMEIFRKLMGVPEDKYTIFRDFKRRVLDKSIEEVNMYSDLIIDPELHREGRQTVQLRFHLKERPRKMRLGVLEVKSDDDANATLKKRLQQDFQLSKEQISMVLSEYQVDFIEAKLTLIQSSLSYQKGKIKNCAAYLLSALKNNYQSVEKTSLDQKNHLHEKQLRAELELNAKKIRKAWRIAQERELDQIIDHLPLAQKNALEKTFRLQAVHAIETVLKLQRKKYSRETILKSPQIRVLFRQFVRQQYPDIMSQLTTFDDFLQSLPTSMQMHWYTLARQEPDHLLIRGICMK